MSTEVSWIESFIDKLDTAFRRLGSGLRAGAGEKLPYGLEVLSYDEDGPDLNEQRYQTDILIWEENEKGWKPRVVIEGKYGSINTHDAITYSRKAEAHRTVHPYLRYGVLLGNRGRYPLPGRLFRHGVQFDFMLSWSGHQAKPREWKTFLDVIAAECHASRQMEEVIYHASRKDRQHFVKLHRRLELE